MKHIFLSYSRKDIEIMRRVREDLSAAGLKVWTDEKLEPGTPSWRKAIESAIEKAGCFVVILSPDAKQSEWVDRELGYATACGLRIIPVLVRGDERSAVPLELINMQRIDIRSDYASVADQLIPTLNTHLGVKPKPRSGQRRPAEPASQPAPKASVTKPKAKTRRPSSPIAGQPSAEELAEIFGFTMEELVLNRQKRLSGRQRMRLLKKSVPFLLMGIFSGSTPVYWVKNLVSTGEFTINGSLLTNVVFFVALIVFAIMSLGALVTMGSYIFPKVKTETGILQRVTSPSGESLYAQIGIQTLDVSSRNLNKMRQSYTRPGWFRAYYVGSGKLLSIEPWNEEKN